MIGLKARDLTDMLGPVAYTRLGRLVVNTEFRRTDPDAVAQPGGGWKTIRSFPSFDAAKGTIHWNSVDVSFNGVMWLPAQKRVVDAANIWRISDATDFWDNATKTFTIWTYDNKSIAIYCHMFA